MEDIKLKNIYYLIGFLGKKYDNKSYLDYSYGYIRKVINQILEIEDGSILELKKTKNTLIHFQNYLLDRERLENIERYMYYYDYPVFYKDYKFNKILDSLYK